MQCKNRRKISDINFWRHINFSRPLYVDDVNPGAETKAARDAQISSTQLVLKKGGFDFKYVVYSGKEPGEKASSDGICKNPWI